MSNKVPSSRTEIIKAVKELEYWIKDKNTPLPTHIANIHKQRLELHFAKHEDHGEFINQWVRLGTRQELQQIPSISDHIIDCLENFVSR